MKDIEWDDLDFEQRLFCNRAEYATAVGDAELQKELQEKNPELYKYALHLIERSVDNC